MYYFLVHGIFFVDMVFKVLIVVVKEIRKGKIMFKLFNIETTKNQDAEINNAILCYAKDNDVNITGSIEIIDNAIDLDDKYDEAWEIVDGAIESGLDVLVRHGLDYEKLASKNPELQKI